MPVSKHSKLPYPREGQWGPNVGYSSSEVTAWRGAEGPKGAQPSRAAAVKRAGLAQLIYPACASPGDFPFNV